MSVESILDKIIRPQYRSKLDTWQRYAKPVDLFGLQCINEIYNTKGTRKIKLNQTTPVEKELNITRGSSFFVQTDARLIPTTTSYKFYHGSSSVSKDPKPSIFQFKRLSEIKISRPLNHMTIAFIQYWSRLSDSKENQQAVLNCLRSLTSKLFLADPHSTQMKTNYDWKNDWKLSKPVRMDKAGQDLFAFKPNLPAIQKQEKKKQQFRQKLKQLQKTEFAKQLKIFKEFKIN